MRDSDSGVARFTDDCRSVRGEIISAADPNPAGEPPRRIRDIDPVDNSPSSGGGDGGRDPRGDGINGARGGARGGVGGGVGNGSTRFRLQHPNITTPQTVRNKENPSVGPSSLEGEVFSLAKFTAEALA